MAEETDCAAIARHLMSEMVSIPAALSKNRLTDYDQIKTRHWTTGHLYIELNTGCHHCIVTRRSTGVKVTDSFINYRTITERTVNFMVYLELVLAPSSTLSQRKEAYEILFSPPPGYIDNWDGVIRKLYMEQLN